MTRPAVDQVSDRALVLYAFARRATIELALGEFQHEPTRVAQAEGARDETDRWLERESLTHAITEMERRLFEAASGAWPKPAIDDALWRREALGVLLWALGHLAEMAPYGEEFPAHDLDASVTRYGSVDAFRGAAPSRRRDRGGVDGGRRVVRRHRGPRRGGCRGRLDGDRTVPGAQLASRRRRRTSVTTPQIASPISAIGTR
jgi:hypothetical protein